VTALRSVAGGRATSSGLVPPHNLEAEEQILAHALTTRRDVAIAVGLGLESGHFFDVPNGRIWQAIVAVAGAPDAGVDHVSVSEWLRARGWLTKIGSPERVRRLAVETALDGPIRGFVRIVVQLARVRALQAEAHLLANEAYGDIGEPEAWLESAPRRLLDRSAGPRANAPQNFGETLKTSWKLFTSTAGVRGGYATGLEPFDASTGGLHPGEVLLVSAKEKAGKSMLVGQWFAAMCEHPYPVLGEDGQQLRDAKGQPVTRRRAALIFALDAAKQTDWAERVAASFVLVDLERFRLGTANELDREALARGIERASALNVFVDGEEIGSVGQMGARIRALRDELFAKGIDLCGVAIDYIQLSKGEGQNREQQISNAMRGVIHLAGQKDLAGIAWVVISQTNNEGEAAHCRALAQMCDGWIHLTVDEDKGIDQWWADTAQGGEMVPIYPTEIGVKRSRRGAMGKRTKPIAVWCCYRFTHFFGGFDAR
jgi:replicative DNA helicase